MIGDIRAFAFFAGLTLFVGAQLACVALAQEPIDPVTGFRREPIRVAAWPGNKKVAVGFALFVEEFGFGQGPVLRPDLEKRNPDLVNEAFPASTGSTSASRASAASSGNRAFRSPPC